MTPDTIHREAQALARRAGISYREARAVILATYCADRDEVR